MNIPEIITFKWDTTTSFYLAMFLGVWMFFAVIAGGLATKAIAGN